MCCGPALTRKWADVDPVLPRHGHELPASRAHGGTERLVDRLAAAYASQHANTHAAAPTASETVLRIAMYASETDLPHEVRGSLDLAPARGPCSSPPPTRGDRAGQLAATRRTPSTAPSRNSTAERAHALWILRSYALRPRSALQLRNHGPHWVTDGAGPARLGGLLGDGKKAGGPAAFAPCSRPSRGHPAPGTASEAAPPPLLCPRFGSRCPLPC